MEEVVGCLPVPFGKFVCNLQGGMWIVPSGHVAGTEDWIGLLVRLF